MNRRILVYVLLMAATGVLAAQQPSVYEGTSNPPADETILTSSTPQAKPPAGHPMSENEAQPQPAPRPQPMASEPPSRNYDADGGMVQGRGNEYSARRPELTERSSAADPDGDIVHPRALRPGELGEGTTIRVRLMQRLSTTSSEKGETFRSRVATDVMQGGQVLIPTGSEISGRVMEVSSGRIGGHGTMRLQPDMVILPDGSRYRLDAELTGTPGSRTRVGGEGTVRPDSRMRRNGLEYGGAVGAGVTTGAIVGGPIGALTGGLIGAGVVTAHLLISHPQAVLDTGSVLLFTLDQPLTLVRATTSEN